jgi:peptidoglycan L-alanyl-D-glutamate endopeptidase CwlK
MAKIDTLNEDFKAQVLILIEALEKSTGIEWVIVQARRTIAYQDSLYNRPTDKIDNDRDGKIDEADEKVTNARGGQSPHNFGDAIDFVPLKDGKEWWDAPKKYWEALGELAEGMGLTWGGHFTSLKDNPHVESADWRQHRADWKAGKIKIG